MYADLVLIKLLEHALIEDGFLFLAQNSILHLELKLVFMH